MTSWTELLNPASPVFAWAILPIFIFLARICDVTLGTIRIIFVTRGLRYFAPVVGFFEVLIWLLAVTQIMRHLNNPWYYLVYAGGYAAGNFVGVYLEHQLAMGVSLVRIITPGNVEPLLEQLRQAGYDATRQAGLGLFEPVMVIFSIVQRKDIRRFVGIIRQYCPDAVYTIEDVRFLSPGAFKNGGRHRFIDSASNSLDCA